MLRKLFEALKNRYLLIVLMRREKRERRAIYGNHPRIVDSKPEEIPPSPSLDKEHTFLNGKHQPEIPRFIRYHGDQG